MRTHRPPLAPLALACLSMPLASAAASARDSLPSRVEIVASGLEIPWALDFAPDGRIFVTERPGRIRVIADSGLDPRPWASLPVANWRAAGLSGIALDPQFDRTGHVFVVGTFRVEDDRFENRIYRFTERAGFGADPVVIVDALPSVDTHAGGAFAFGPDGKLYLAVGDGERIEEVQDPRTTTGKVLRYEPDGTIPADNPVRGSPVFAIGLRNSQGFAWHPGSGDLFATEHGPSGFEAESGRRDEDELNVIRSGANYGWPIVSGLHDDPRYVRPLTEWTPAIAPSGLAIVPLPSAPHAVQLFVGALRGQHLRRVVLEPAANETAGWIVRRDEVLFDRRFGRIRAVRHGPDGLLYFTTSNRDTPGEPIRKLALDGDDKVYRTRLTP